MKRAIPLTALLLASFLFTWSALAANSYDLSWWTVDGGGDTFGTGGTYTLGGTIGQPDASAELTGGSYALLGGFWGGQAHYEIYLPMVVRGGP